MGQRILNISDIDEPPVKRPGKTKSSSRLASKKPRKALSSDQFKQLVDAVSDYAIFMLDTSGHILTWNTGAKRIKGYEASEIIGKHFSIFYPEQDVRARKPDFELEEAAREGRFEDEGWRLRKDGSQMWANVIITALRDAKGELKGFGKVTRDFSQRKEQEERLAQSEERFRLLVEGASDYAIYMLDPHGRVTTWNAGAEKIKGYSEEEILGQNFAKFFTEEDIKAGRPAAILERAAAEGRSEHEGWRVRKDGSRFWVNANVTAIRNDAGELIGFSKITRDVTEKMLHQQRLQIETIEKEKAQQELTKSEESLRRLSLNLLRTQDEERRRIGREMHDSLGQYLSVLKMKLGILHIQLPGLTAQASEVLSESAALLDQCVKEVRTISYLLYPPMLEEMGLGSAIGWYLDGFTQRSGIQTTLHVSDNFERLSRDTELALFRVLQESLTNVHKHSGSTTAEIHLGRANGNVSLAVRDYGKGAPEAVLSQSSAGWAASPGVGLRGMSERIHQLGGRLEVSAAEPGTRVEATVPAQVASETNKET